MRLQHLLMCVLGILSFSSVNCPFISLFIKKCPFLINFRSFLCILHTNHFLAYLWQTSSICALFSLCYYFIIIYVNADTYKGKWLTHMLWSTTKWTPANPPQNPDWYFRSFLCALIIFSLYVIIWRNLNAVKFTNLFL